MKDLSSFVSGRISKLLARNQQLYNRPEPHTCGKNGPSGSSVLTFFSFRFRYVSLILQVNFKHL